MNTDRESTLDDEFLRVTPGLRPFSVLILRLCRKLDLKLAMGGAAATADERTRELTTAAWLMDERHSVAEIRLGAQDAEKLESTLDDYEETVSPAFLARVQAEITRMSVAVAAINFEIEAKPVKPGTPPPDTPSGK